MTLCSDSCIPCCDYCKYVIYEQLLVGSKQKNGEPIGCKLHPDRESLCDDFYCCLVDESSDPATVVEGLITTICNEIHNSPYSTEYLCEDGTIIRTDVGYVMEWFEEYQDVLRRRYGIYSDEEEVSVSAVFNAFNEIDPGDKVEIYEQ